MKKYSILLLTIIVMNGCSILRINDVYKGFYKNKKIELYLDTSKSGKFVINKNDTIPFKYKIEKSKFLIKEKNNIKREIDFYVYRFTINAEYNLNFPVGFYEIGQKRGNVIQNNNGITLVKEIRK